VHNTYFTLPVLFAMLSNHYNFLYGGDNNWVVLVAVMFAGAAIRQFFVMRHGYKLGRNAHPWPYAAVGVVVLLGMIAWLKPAAPSAAAAAAQAAPATTEQVLAVAQQRCVMCHGAGLQSKGLRFDTADGLKASAQLIYQQVVVQRTMPLNNATGITDDERALIGRWVQGGTKD